MKKTIIIVLTSLLFSEADCQPALVWSNTLSDTVSEYTPLGLKMGINYEMFIGGNTYNTVTGIRKYFIVSYSSTGNFNYGNFYSAGYDNYFNDLDVDNFNNAYISGLHDDTLSPDFFDSTHSISITGNTNWSLSFNSNLFPNNNITFLANCISNNHLFIAATSYQSVELAKYDLGGNLVATVVNDSINGKTVEHVIADNAGDIIVAGGYIDGTANGKIFIKKFDSALNFQWESIFTSAVSTGTIKGIKTDLQNNIYILHRVGGSQSELIKIESNGNISFLIPVSAIYNNFPSDLLITSDAIYTSVYRNAAKRENVLQKFNKQTGAFQWEAISDSGFYGPSFLASEYDDHLFWICNNYVNFTQTDFAIMRYDSAGTKTWGYINNHPDSDVVKSAFADSSDCIYLVATDINQTKLKTFKYCDVTSVKNEELTQSIQVFPNPTSGSFKIIADNGVIDKIELLDLFGKVFYHQKVNSNETIVNNLNVANGIYFLKLDTDKGIAHKKIEVMR